MNQTTTHEPTGAMAEGGVPRPGAAVAFTSVRRVYRATRKEPARTALDSVSLTVARGEWLSILGPNGSGKSTLLRIIATLDRPDSGGVTILDQAGLGGGSVRAVRARIGVVFQHPGLDPLMTVRENLLLQAALVGMTRSDAEQRVHFVAASLGVTDRLNSRVGTLSGGLARRADLARALLSEPELLLLDEPTAGLDPEARTVFLDLLSQRRLDSAAPLTIIMTTHHMDEAERGSRVALMHAGRIVTEGKPAELRRALGGNVVVTRSENASLLESAGLTLTRTAPDAVGAGSPDGVERAVVALTRAAAPFSVGPPTLADVYFAHTGARLNSTAETP
ncbi:MAG: ABC transporter ATP-binding protein [Phycisphaerae bacterium]|nr:ABC transporter ATP-binding protein [Phycisphaerae bacterium]